MTGPFPSRYNPEKHQWTLESAMHMLDWNISALTKLRDELPSTWGRVCDWTPGLSAGNDVTVSGGRVGDDGATNGRTQAAALARLTERSSGPAVDFHIILEGAVNISRTNLRLAPAIARLRVAEPVSDVMEPKRPAGSGICGNPSCGWVCSGERNDRIRRGRCRDCFVYRERHGEERPHQVCHRVEVPNCRQCLRDALLEAGAAPDDVVGLVDGRSA